MRSRTKDDMFADLEVESPEPRPKDMDDRFRLMHEALEDDESIDEAEGCAGPLSKFWSHRNHWVETQQEDE